MRFVSTAMHAARRAGIAVIRAIPPLMRDAVGVSGAGMIVYGVWQMHQPSAWIVGGIFLVATAWRLAVRPRLAGEVD
jgi:hypothetical protein